MNFETRVCDTTWTNVFFSLCRLRSHKSTLHTAHLHQYSPLSRMHPETTFSGMCSRQGLFQGEICIDFCISFFFLSFRFSLRWSLRLLLASLFFWEAEFEIALHGVWLLAMSSTTSQGCRVPSGAMKRHESLAESKKLPGIGVDAMIHESRLS